MVNKSCFENVYNYIPEGGMRLFWEVAVFFHGAKVIKITNNKQSLGLSLCFDFDSP